MLFINLRQKITVAILTLLNAALDAIANQSHPPALPASPSPEPGSDFIEVEAIALPPNPEDLAAIAAAATTPRTALPFPNLPGDVYEDLEATFRGIENEADFINPTLPEKPLSPKERAQLVYTLLDEAWGMGKRSYTQLAQHVKEQTGRKCSSSTISKWKVDRSLSSNTIAESARIA